MRMKQGLALGTVLGALMLAGCHKSAPEETPVDNTPVIENEMPAPEPETEPPVANNSMAEAPRPPKPQPQPAPKISADQQMLDDAAATGMTTRTDRNTSSGATNREE